MSGLPRDEARTFEELLASGEIESALILKGKWSRRDAELARDVFESAARLFAAREQTERERAESLQADLNAVIALAQRRGLSADLIASSLGARESSKEAGAA